MDKIEYIGKCLLVETEKKRILVIGDLHLGYEDVLENAGIFAGRRILDEAIDYLNRVFKKVGKIDEIVLLGDVKHYFGSILKQERGDIIKLLNYFLENCNKVVITEGNHDKILAPILTGKDKVELVCSYIAGNVGFMHGDRNLKEIIDNDKIKSIVIAHLHPAIRLREKEGIKEEKYKCYLVERRRGKEWIIMPSFSENYIGSDPRENLFGEFNRIKLLGLDLKKFDVKVVEENSLNVLDFGKLGKID